MTASRSALSLGVVLATLAGCGRDDGGRSATTDESRPPVEAHVSVDRAVATTGDVLTYTVRLDYDPAYEVEMTDPGGEIAGLRVVDLGREAPRELRGRRVEERWYKLRGDLVGSYVLPPIRVSYWPEGATEDPEASSPETLTTSEIFVEVASVLTGDEEDIRDLKPLRPIGDFPLWPVLGLSALGLLVVAATAFFLVRRLRNRPAPPPLLPHEAAFRELGRLRQSDFQDPAALRRYYFELSETVRRYVEGRFALNATDLTSEEIVGRLDEIQGLGPEPSETLQAFLTETDQVKFAAHRPVEDEIEGTYERALHFVETTRPAGEPAQPATGGAS